LLAPAAAHADDPFMQRVLVEGARASQVGVAGSAGMGSVSQRQLDARTIYRPGELLEATPGLVASQHSGEGKANQFYLRGFNLDHGTDLRTSVDGMPVNQRSHAHGQGWTDLNFIIPELVARLDYNKGPYKAATGDFSSAGATAITYSSRLPQDLASATVGQDGYGRALLAGTREGGGATDGSGGAWPGTWLYALETAHNDGPFTRGDNYRKLNAVLRYSQGFANNGFTVTAMAYRGAWNATDQVPQRAVVSGLLGRFDGIDLSDGGQSRRFSLSAAWARSSEQSTSRANAYIVNNRLQLFSNFTYFLDDPVHGDQFAQPDRRVTSGFEASHSWHDHMDDMAWRTTLGLQAQNDNIFNALQHTQARQVLATVRADHIVETSAALYLEQHLRVTPWLRGEAGLRLDRYRFAVGTARAGATLASPSLSLAFGPWRHTEFYLNAGRGFHSNDARGVTQAGDPATPLARSRGLEFGLRSEAVKGLQTVLALYRLDFDSELVYLGDAGTTEAGRASRRHGIEFSNYYKPFKWLSLDADLAFARGRFRRAPAAAADGQPVGDRIPGAVEGVAQLAATVTPAGPWSGALRLRWFGPRPLAGDNAVRSKASATLNGRLAYKAAPGTTIEREGFNLANRQVEAIDYFYESRLQGEATGRADIHFHPIEARSFRLSLNHAF
jgi:hypothetical protein